MNPTIAIALRVFKAGPRKPNAEMIEDLVGAGLNRRLAVQLFLLLPVAYCRTMFEPHGVHFPDYFQLSDESGAVIVSIPFSSVSFLSDALAAAKMSCDGDESFIAVAGRSAEFRAVNQLLLSGAELKNISCSAGLMSRKHFEEYVTPPPPGRRPAWWKFWEKTRDA